MGTNFYVTKNRPSVYGGEHIGKSSIGWRFLFHRVNEPWNDPPIVWNTWQQVKDWLYKYTVESTDYVILDEYDTVVPFDEFVDMVEWKQQDERCRNNPDNFKYCDDIDGYRFTDRDFS